MMKKRGLFLSAVCLIGGIGIACCKLAELLQASKSIQDNMLSETTLGSGQEVKITGVAGNLDDKGNTPCLWLFGENKIKKDHIVVNASWCNEVVGRKISVIGTVSKIDIKNEWGQRRSSVDESEMMLRDVRAVDGRPLGPKCVQSSDNPFGDVKGK